MSRDDAIRAAHREFGNATLVEERGRDVWRWHFVEDAWADLRYAARQWRRAPAFAVATLATLALGIGANTAVFSVVNGLVLRPLPFPRRLPRRRAVGRPPQPVARRPAYPNFFDFRRSTRTLSHLSSYRESDFTLTGRGSLHLRGQIVSWEFFQTLEVAPALGRDFVPADEQPGARVVVLSHETWTRVFGADPAVIGQAGHQRRAARDPRCGPGRVRLPHRATADRMWTTLAHDASSGTRTPVTEQRGARVLGTIARLGLGVTLDQARAEMDAIAASLLQQFPDQNANVPSADVRTRSTACSGRCATRSCCCGARSRSCC